jgi:hypothetical protein
MMLPMSVRCKTCGTFMYKGTKFNTRKEDVEGEDYLGLRVSCEWGRGVAWRVVCFGGVAAYTRACMRRGGS